MDEAATPVRIFSQLSMLQIYTYTAYTYMYTALSMPDGVSALDGSDTTDVHVYIVPWSDEEIDVRTLIFFFFFITLEPRVVGHNNLASS